MADSARSDRPQSDRRYGFRTRAIHAGNIPDAVSGSRALPIYQSSAFVFDDTADAAARFALQKYGNIYSRLANPTVASFEERVASLEGGLGAVATASGLGAEFITFAALAGAGDHIVAASQLYGGTVTQLDVTLRRFGVDTTFVAGTDPADYAAAIRDNTKLVFAETVANPSGEIADIEGLAEVAHAAGVPLVIDATVATPYLNRPIEWGADIVVHSATKFLGGHGTTLGGIVVESGRFPWGSHRFPLFEAPTPSYGGLSWEGNFGEYGFLTRLRAEQLRDIGPALAPHSAWLLAQGVETLPFRMQAHVDNGPPASRARGQVPAARAGIGVQLRREGRPRGRPAVHRERPARQPPRQHRRREDARHPSRVDHPCPAQRAAARRRGRAPRPRPHQRRHRGRGRHHRRSRPSARRGAAGGLTP
jgi:O-acetylhomoserine (thiol)-lyase